MDRRKIAAIAAACRNRGGLSLIDANVVFLGRSAAWDDYSELSVDQSGNGNDLTDAETYAHSVALPAGITTHGTVELLVQVRDGISNVYGMTLASADTILRARMLAGNGNDSFQAGTSVANTISIPNLEAGYRTYLWAWVTEPNPDTTGPSNASKTTHHVWDIAADEYATTGNTHAVVPETTRVALGASNPGGGNLFATDGHGRIRHVRISNVARSRAELEALIPLITAGEAP
jgi:hypothetical protein